MTAVALDQAGLDGTDTPWPSFVAADFRVTIHFHTIPGPPDSTTLIFVRRG